MKMKTTALKMLMLTTFLFVLEHAVAVEYPGPTPGPADAVIHGNRISAGNQALIATWILSETGLSPGGYRDIQSGAALEMTEDVFQIVLGDETTYRTSAMKPLGPPVVKEHSVQPDCSRLAGRVQGKQIEFPMMSDDGRLRVVWRAVILDEANYVRQEIDLTVAKEPLTIREVTWLSNRLPALPSAGSVDGSLVVVGPFFAGCEDPMAENRVLDDESPKEHLCRLRRDAPSSPGEVLTLSFVVGVAPEARCVERFSTIWSANELIPIDRSCTTTPGTTLPGHHSR